MNVQAMASLTELPSTGNSIVKAKSGLTKRAPDAGESAHIPSSFPRLIIFLAGRLRRPHPSAGNANRWAFPCKAK